MIKDLDVPDELTGLLGIYLLICAYASIGLFMSSVTSYQVVAAMGTLAIFALLNVMKSVGQSIDLVREITYWLSIDGRCDQFVRGMICSEDVLYFLIVIVLFLTLSIVRLGAIRQKAPWQASLGKYVGIVILAIGIGFLSSRPTLKCFYDATATINLGAEIALAPKWTIDVSGNYNAWDWRDNRKWKHFLVQPEEGVTVMKILDAVYASAASGKPVEITA